MELTNIMLIGRRESRSGEILERLRNAGFDEIIDGYVSPRNGNGNFRDLRNCQVAFIHRSDAALDNNAYYELALEASRQGVIVVFFSGGEASSTLIEKGACALSVNDGMVVANAEAFLGHLQQHSFDETRIRGFVDGRFTDDEHNRLPLSILYRVAPLYLLAQIPEFLSQEGHRDLRERLGIGKEQWQSLIQNENIAESLNSFPDAEIENIPDQVSKDRLRDLQNQYRFLSKHLNMALPEDWQKFADTVLDLHPLP